MNKEEFEELFIENFFENPQKVLELFVESIREEEREKTIKLIKRGVIKI